MASRRRSWSVAPTLRTGGYVVDFWGLGYDIAERMGLLPEIDRVGYHVRELRMVNDRGRARGRVRHKRLRRVDRRTLRHHRAERSLEIDFQQDRGLRRDDLWRRRSSAFMKKPRACA